MRSFLSKAEPFFENIVMGLGFAWMGYLFFWTFNRSLLGSLGMLAVLYAGYKLLIGAIVYGVYLYALIFHRDKLKNKDEKDTVEPIPTAEGEGLVVKEKMLGATLESNSPKAPVEEAKPDPPKTPIEFLRAHWFVLVEILILAVGFTIIIVVRNG